MLLSLDLAGSTSSSKVRDSILLTRVNTPLEAAQAPARTITIDNMIMRMGPNRSIRTLGSHFFTRRVFEQQTIFSWLEPKRLRAALFLIASVTYELASIQTPNEFKQKQPQTKRLKVWDVNVVNTCNSSSECVLPINWNQYPFADTNIAVYDGVGHYA